MADEDSKRMWDSLRLAYTETQGLPALRQAVADVYHTSIQAKDLVVLAPEEGVYLTMRALLQPGDHVVVSYPGYQSLFEVAASMGCSVTFWEPQLSPDGGVAFSVKQLKELLTQDTKLVVCNFPHNPTGSTLSHQDWQDLIAACKAVGCWLFSDEMYRLMELEPSHRLPSAADCYDHAISLNGCSKALALPGIRLGWIACQQASLLTRVMELKDYTTICAAAPSEVLALMAVRSSATILERNLGLIRDNLAAFGRLVADFPDMLAWVPPAASSVAFPRLTTGEDVSSFCDRLVASEGVLLLPASVLDHEPSAQAGHFRVGLGRRDLPACLDKLRAFLERERERRAGDGAAGDSK